MKTCPRCYEKTLEDEQALNSLSKRDNKTYICNGCGDEEACIDLGELWPSDVEKRFVTKIWRQS